ncbi:MAG TPA: sugar ABC transporter substrate-binding protein [Candidatus Lachnoclostridium stercorigallinarum]|uniref:Sugar ABC transporter substrate-binding protein n=1 Tax=Candidatus Lachnoclostridium stercorigallinarum TaxID=2838634 RepID=A0A9D2GEU8_9FIRM|nr:sugar ABC transporter substrate-binding protein [Candidatus Lachnoclostridium stercorigallinarum]
MRKNMMAAAAVLTAAAVMSGCTQSVADAVGSGSQAASSGAEESSQGEGSGYRIGIFTKDSTTAFWRYVVEGAQDRAAELGVEVVEYAPASYTDSAGQLSMVEDSISAGIDAICIAACDSTAIVPALEKASSAGIPVIVFNTSVPDFEDNITFVGVDNYDASYRVTEELIKAHDGKGKLVLIEGDPAGYQNIERTRAVTDLLEQYPEVELVTRQPGYANRESSMNAMENVLQAYDEIDMVWAINDVAAMGCVQAIEGSGRTGIDVIGIDGTPEGATAVKDGRLKYTIDQGPFDQGALSVQAAVDYLNGETVEDNYATGGTIVTAENAEAFLEEYYPDFNQ